jgi:hypothetical protein
MGERLLAISPFSDTGWIALQYGPLAPTIDAWLTADREYFAFLSTHLMNIPEAEQKQRLRIFLDASRALIVGAKGYLFHE